MVRNLIFLFLVSIGLSSFAKEVPKPNKGECVYVQDFADVLSSDQVHRLCKKLRNYDDTTSNQIAIYLDESLEGEDVFTYSNKAAKAWGVGGDENNNGILIYAAMKERKLFIQVGRGLEHRITDALAGRVVDYVLKPNFKQVGYYQGLDEAVDNLILYAAGEYKGTGKSAKNGFPAWLGIVLFIILLIILSNFGNSNGKTYHNNRGGGWIIGGGGGGFTGGGGSSGGFGGFGGGSFGGGGAGGSW